MNGPGKVPPHTLGWQSVLRLSTLRYEAQRPTTMACTRLPTNRFVNHTFPATMPVVGVGLAGSAAGKAKAWAQSGIEE